MGSLSQASLRLDLEWNQGDPVSLLFLWPDEDLTGSYTALIRDAEVYGDIVGELTVITTFVSGEGTEFALQDFDATIQIGRYWWSLTEDGGVTRLAGRVDVLDGRQVGFASSFAANAEVVVTTEVTEVLS